MKKILVANRGEIAVRIIRAARESGYESVAVYSDQDLASLHVAVADRAMPLNGITAAQTYLDADKIIAAARESGADAVHPGYGFLSENADFARAVGEAGLTWIGPKPETIDALGNKVTARTLAESVGAPLVSGTEGPINDTDELHEFASAHGLPLAIKAVHGGGGRGMRVVRREEDLEEAYQSATSEAKAAFGRGECFVEQFLDRPRHIEAQVIADVHGNVVVVGTRDCSLQRRNQKLVEEAPAPFLSRDIELRVIDSARAICAKAGYVGAGTVEYLLSPEGVLSFLEVNTRLQVEHPVTEESTGIDLVAEQFRIAEGLELSIQETPIPTSHAFEFRLNAEDPALGYIPLSGEVTAFAAPSGPGIRVDTGIRSGGAVAREFDSMIAKLIVRGPDRSTALLRARAALQELRIEGIPSVLPFHQAVVDHPDFAAVTGAESFNVHTRWIETDFASEFAESPHLKRSVGHRDAPLSRTIIEIDGRAVELGFPAGLFSTATGGDAPTSGGEPVDDGDVLSSLNGTLVRWNVEDGDAVVEGQPLAVIEAMKMETSAIAHITGRFARGAITPGGEISRGDVLGTITPAG